MNMPQKGLTMIDDKNHKEVDRLIAGEFVDSGEVLAGVIEDNPIKEPLGGSEYCMYMCFNIFFIVVPAGLCAVFGVYSVEPLQAKVFTAFEKVYYIEKTPGLHWIFRCCLEEIDVDLSVQTMQIPSYGTLAVPDSTGSPMNVSCIVNFVIEDPINALFGVENYRSFIEMQGSDVIKRICSKFRYRSNDPNEVSILADGHHIMNAMRKLLGKRCKVAGIKIMKMNFANISFASEVAQQLL
jgi:regulator of protease activity HflC (stomatin/prohibitin superfamily)